MIMTLISLKQVTEKIGVGKSMIYKMIKDGDFPRPVKIGSISRWVEEDVDAWLMKRIEESRRTG